MAIATNLNKACPSNSEHFDAVKSNPPHGTYYSKKCVYHFGVNIIHKKDYDNGSLNFPTNSNSSLALEHLREDEPYCPLCPPNSQHIEDVTDLPIMLGSIYIYSETEGYVNYGILLESMRNPESPSTLSGWVGNSRVKVTMGDGESTFPIVDNLENIRILKFAHVKDEEYITDFKCVICELEQGMTT
ncbi:hypothetical protein BDQ17DRAFT_1430171 [Cyathus striatus]|nr:hypothetical protein BDQ17DRAFT_1430171 [Cyathus striatus]